MTLFIPLAIVATILIWTLRPRQSPSSSLMAAILAVIVPIVVIAVTAIVLQWRFNANGNTGVSDAANICFITTLGLIAVSLLALAGTYIAHERDIAKGIGFSACIAVLVSMVELGILEGLAGV